MLPRFREYFFPKKGLKHSGFRNLLSNFPMIYTIQLIFSLQPIQALEILDWGNCSHPNKKLGGGFKYVLFSSLPGEMIQFDEHIIQLG